MNAARMAREMVGDNKAPNRYFVSIHDDNGPHDINIAI